MLTEKFRKALEEYHRKKWFPDAYPDPFGEFIDYISEGMISDLMNSWKQNKTGSQLDSAYYIIRILPQIEHRELLKDYRAAFSKHVSSLKILPEFAPYYARTLNEEQSRDFWDDFRNWNEQWETVLSDWNSALLSSQNQHAGFFNLFDERLGFASVPEFNAIENHLRDTRELFAWQMQQQIRATNYREMLRQFDFPRWKSVADWSDLPSLAKSVAEACGFIRIPTPQSSEEPAAQFVFSVAPPTRVILQYGRASGPLDALRFLAEYGKGLFYKGINPDLKSEERICGDPSLPYFWGHVLTSLLTETAGIKHFIGLQAQGLESDTSIIMETENRHEAALALYRNDAMNNRKNIQNHYLARWDLAFGFEPPRFLYLFDLSRSMESFYKAFAANRAKEAVQVFRTKYGSKWFTSTQWSKRVRDYWWEGFRLTTKQVLRDI
jgi:hypothetical protein